MLKEHHAEADSVHDHVPMCMHACVCTHAHVFMCVCVVMFGGQCVKLEVRLEIH